MWDRRSFLGAGLTGLAGATFLTGRLGAALPTVTDAASAATVLLAECTKEQRQGLQYKLNDEERFGWHFVPLNDTKTKSSTSKGVCLDDMTATAKAAAMQLLKFATSADGLTWCSDIMEREAILAELEPMNAWYRKPGWYFFTIYGTPANTGSWAWRVDGHHLSMSVAYRDGQLISASPLFLGLNPVTIKHGQREGERKTMTASEDLARDLYRMLNADQQKEALLAEHLPEVKALTLAAATTLAKGINAGKFSNKQQDALLDVVKHYTGRMHPDVAKLEYDAIVKSGVEKLTFAYSGEAEPGKRHTYAIQGGAFLIHYLNEQTDPQKNPANHIHSLFRSRLRDFGGVKPA